MQNNSSKTIYRYDSRGSGFKKAAFLLFGLSIFMFFFGIYWIYTWM
jgi:hypothetical protein